MGYRPYKSEQKTSIAFATAFENSTVRQTLVNTIFPQSEFGMRAGRCRRSRRASHMIKTGIRATLIINRAILAGREMYETEPVSVLHKSEQITPPSQSKDELTQEYKRRWQEMSTPSMLQPSQSLSSA